MSQMIKETFHPSQQNLNVFDPGCVYAISASKSTKAPGLDVPNIPIHNPAMYVRSNVVYSAVPFPLVYQDNYINVSREFQQVPTRPGSHADIFVTVQEGLIEVMLQ